MSTPKKPTYVRRPWRRLLRSNFRSIIVLLTKACATFNSGGATMMRMRSLIFHHEWAGAGNDFASHIYGRPDGIPRNVNNTGTSEHSNQISTLASRMENYGIPIYVVLSSQVLTSPAVSMTAACWLAGHKWLYFNCGKLPSGSKPWELMVTHLKPSLVANGNAKRGKKLDSPSPFPFPFLWGAKGPSSEFRHKLGRNTICWLIWSALPKNFWP